MVRVGGLQYSIAPNEKMGSRIGNLRLGSKPIEAGKLYKVAGWAPVAEAARDAGHKPVWDVVEAWLRSQDGGRVAGRRINAPDLVGMGGNAGIAP
jgi:sulfur-oxidizing protein SoxB